MPTITMETDPIPGRRASRGCRRRCSARSAQDDRHEQDDQAAPNATDPFWSGNRWTAPATVTPSARSREAVARPTAATIGVRNPKTRIMPTTIIATDHPTATTPADCSSNPIARFCVFNSVVSEAVERGPSNHQNLRQPLDRQVGAHYDAQQRQAGSPGAAAPQFAQVRDLVLKIGDSSAAQYLAVLLVRLSDRRDPSST